MLDKKIEYDIHVIQNHSCNPDGFGQANNVHKQLNLLISSDIKQLRRVHFFMETETFLIV